MRVPAVNDPNGPAVWGALDAHVNPEGDFVVEQQDDEHGDDVSLNMTREQAILIAREILRLAGEHG